MSRGGFVPAAIIANMLGIKNVDTVSLSSYSDETKLQECQLQVLKSSEQKPGKWVIIDDLADTGNSARKLKEMFPNATIACVYAKPKGESSINLFVKSIPQEQWIVFPWEPRD